MFSLGVKIHRLVVNTDAHIDKNIQTMPKDNLIKIVKQG
ncbi:hypothetical protein LMG33818_001326 [Halomonadaceae bacterium LMG 33818]